MKTILKAGLMPATVLLASVLGGCQAESEFQKEGEGVLKLQMIVNSNVTRAIENEDYLRSNCVVYISDQKGLLYKYQGLENVPSEIHMKNGSYTAEAWTGDSVSASFDKKFFRGYEPFEINGGTSSVVVKCKIANVVASINHATIDPEAMKDWKVTFGHSRGSLDITEENQAEKAYFMMPNADKDLTYTVTGTTANGSGFKKEGIIPNVQRAHEYVLNFTYTPEEIQTGGAFIQIIIDDQAVEEESDIPMYSAPSIKGADFDISHQLTGSAGDFPEAICKISAFGGLRNLVLSCEDYAVMGWPGEELDLMNLTETPAATMNHLGITWDFTHNADHNLTTAMLHFGDKFLSTLPERDTEYVINITATDIYGKENTAPLRIAVGEGAVVFDDPATLEPISPTDQMAVTTHQAQLDVTVNDPEASGLRLEYRPYGDETWQNVSLAATRGHRRAAGQHLKVTLKNLTAATRYEYRIAADDFQGESFFFTTEGIFTIPNAGMEEWSQFVGNSKIMMPSDDGTKKFWDTGNHGSATMSVNITNPTTSMFHSGSKAAELKSQFVGIAIAGKLAAGNIFAGEYLETQGTDGRLSFGRPYDGSHPTKLRLWVNYRPAKAVKSKGANSSYIGEGKSDIAQIYTALTTEQVEIRTKKSDQKLFNPNDACVLAYGQATIEGNYGPDGQLQMLEIPYDYYAAAQSNKPLFLVIVCSASKYGDYFSGGDGSIMVVDDFELIYE